MRRIGTELIEEKRAEFLSERLIRSSKPTQDADEEEEEFERGNEGRDLLSVLSAFPSFFPPAPEKILIVGWEQLGQV